MLEAFIAEAKSQLSKASPDESSVSLAILKQASKWGDDNAEREDILPSDIYAKVEELKKSILPILKRLEQKSQPKDEL